MAGARVDGPPGVDEPGAIAQVTRVQQVGRAHLGHEAFVCHPAVGVGKGELDGLDLQVLALDAVDAVSANVQLLQHAQRHQRGNPLAIRWQFVHRVAGEGHLDGLDPLHFVGGQVAGAQLRAVFARKRFDGGGNLAPVKGLATRLRDAAQGAARLSEGKAFAGQRGAATWQKRLGETGLVVQQRHRQGPFVRNDGRHRRAAFGQFDGRFEEVCEGQGAEAFGQRRPAGHRAGHRDGVKAPQRNLAAVLLVKVGLAPAGGRHAG